MIAGGWSASALAALVPTPRQSAGPFYPQTKPVDSDADLVQVAGQPRRARGIVAHVFGRVLDPAGRPIEGAAVEIWQCDADGRYHHPSDRGGRGGDPGFQGYGRTRADADGGYRFRTIRPVAYPGRTPHIHVAVATPNGRRLTTQLYVAGDVRNERDFLYRGLGAAATQVTVPFDPAPDIEPNALAASFDIVVG